MPGDSIEFWQSGPDGSLADGAFQLIGTVPDTAPRWLVERNVQAGRLYAEKARRYSSDLADYSDFCAPVFAVVPYPRGISPVLITTTGVQTKLGIANEAVFGSPVVSQKLIDRKSGSLEMTLDNPTHESLRGIDGDVEDVPGKATIGAPTKNTITPEGISRILNGFLAFPTSVQTNAPTGAAPGAAATVVPAGGGAAGGLLAAGIYFLKFTIVTTATGAESPASPESATFTVAAGNIPQVTFAGAPAAGTTYNIYLTAPGGASGTERLYATGIGAATANLAVAAPGSTQQVPAGNPAVAPTVNVTGGGVTGGALAAGVYFAKYTLSSGAGQETLPSPESATFTVAAGNIPLMTFPDTPPPGMFYNVYLTPAGGGAGTEVLYVIGVTTALLSMAIAAAAQSPVPPATNTLTSSFNTHTWKNSFADQSVCLTELKGPVIFVYPGATVEQLDITVDKDQQTPVEMDTTWMALNQLIYNNLSEVGLDTAGFDPLPAFGPAQIGLSIAGIVSNAAKTASFQLKRNRVARDVLNMYRGPVQNLITKSTGSGTLGTYFDSITENNRFWGQVDSLAAPYGATKKRRTVPIVLTLQSEVNANGFRNILQLVVPRAAYKKVNQPIDGSGPVMQSIEWTAYYDSISSSLFYFVLRNNESYAAITGPGIALDHVPANDVQPLTY